MSRIRKMSASQLLRYLTQDPMQRLPAMLDPAEKPDRSGQYGRHAAPLQV